MNYKLPGIKLGMLALGYACSRLIKKSVTVSLLGLVAAWPMGMALGLSIGTANVSQCYKCSLLCISVQSTSMYLSFIFLNIIPVREIFKYNYYICFCHACILYPVFSLFGCRIFFVEGTRSILLGMKSMPCIFPFEQESCDVVASRTKSLQ